MHKPLDIDKHVLQLVEKLPVPTVISAGNTDSILLLNQAFTELFGYDLSDFPNVDDWWIRAYPDETYRRQILTAWTAAAENAIAERKLASPIEATITCKDGTTRNVHCSLASIGELNIVSMVDITDHKNQQAEIERQLTFSIQSHDALLRLSKLPLENLEQYIYEAVEIAAKTLNVSQVGVWFLSKDQTEFEQIDTYILESDIHESGDRIYRSDFPVYFEALDAGRMIDACDAQNDPRTSEFAANYLIPFSFVSMLDAPIRRNGKMIGAVCHEQTGTSPRVWTRLEQNFAASIADIIALATESLERRQAEEALRSSEKSLVDTINALDDYIHVVDSELRIVVINEAFAREMVSLGFAKDSLGRTLREVIPFLPEKVFNEYHSIFKNGNTLSTEEVTLVNGCLYYTRTTKIPIFEGDKVAKVLTKISDVSEWRTYEASLRENEERYRDLFENSPICIWEKNFSELKAYLDGLKRSGVQDIASYLNDNPDALKHALSLRKVSDVNQKTIEFFGVGNKQTAIQWCEKCFGEDAVPILIDEIVALANGDQKFQAEIPVRMPSGESKILFLSVSISPMFTESWSRVLVSSVDVTESKEAEQLRFADENRLQSLLRIAEHRTATSEEMLDFALNELVAASDSQFGYIYGYSEETEDFTLFNWSEQVMDQCSIPSPPINYHLDKTGLWGEAVRQRKPIIVNDFDANNPLKKGYPAGHAPIHKFLTIPVIIEGKIVGVAGLANKPTDYTNLDVRQLTLMMDSVWKVIQRAQAEEALKVSEQKYRLLFENMTAGFALHEMIYDEAGNPVDYRYLEVNPAFARLTGVPSESLIGRTVKDLMPKTEPYWIETFGRVARTGEPIAYQNYSEEFGRYYDTWSFCPAKDRFAVVFTDITKRKKAEEEAAAAKAEVEKRAAQMESLVTNVADGVAQFDSEGNLVFINRAGRDILGAPDTQSLTDMWSMREIYTLDGERLGDDNRPINRALRGEKITDLRLRVLTQWREDLLVSVSAAPICNLDGKILGGTIVFRDQSERIELEQKREELYVREHKIAQALQEALLPHDLPSLPAFDISVIYEAASRDAEVGGDFYDAFEIGNEKLAIVIGDVTGKGLAAAARVASARHTIRSCAYVDPSPSKVMTLANEVLRKSATGIDDSIITAVYALVDARTNEVTLANGGHEPLVLRKASGEVTQIYVQGRVLGVEGCYTFPEITYKLEAGDCLVFVTDGITEARRNGGEFFGVEGVSDLVASVQQVSAHCVASELLSAAKSFCGGELRDDAAVLTLVVKEQVI